MATELKAAVLNSRQPLRPCGRTEWVVGTARAVRWAKDHGCALLSSCGLQTWEMVTVCASTANLRQILYLPASDQAAFENARQAVSGQFDLSDGAVDFVPIIRPGAGQSELQQLRDDAIIRDADILLPVSIRPGGNMARHLAGAISAGKSVVEDFRTPYIERETPLAYTLAAADLGGEIRAIGSEYLIHWTRSANSAWPTERLLDYYRAVAGSENYPRSAFHTLANILSLRRIVASPRKMPGGAATVSFSDLSPTEVVPLMRWRARRSQMSFEPYGIGIAGSHALAHGIQPVAYYARGNRASLSCPDWLTQSSGTITDWRAEREYRWLGDFDLSTVPVEQLVAFVYRREEAEMLHKQTGLRAVPFVP